MSLTFPVSLGSTADSGNINEDNNNLTGNAFNHANEHENEDKDKIKTFQKLLKSNNFQSLLGINR